MPIFLLQTSHTIGFLLHCLAANPDKQQKLRDEVDVVIKESNGGRITAEQTHKLKYFQMCLKESFRLYPILFINGRKIREDFISRNRNIQFKKDVGDHCYKWCFDVVHTCLVHSYF